MKTYVKFFIISLISSYNEKFSDKICREKKPFYSVTFFFEILAVYDIMWKSIVEPGKPQDSMAHSHRMLNN